MQLLLQLDTRWGGEAEGQEQDHDMVSDCTTQRHIHIADNEDQTEAHHQQQHLLKYQVCQPHCMCVCVCMWVCVLSCFPAANVPNCELCLKSIFMWICARGSRPGRNTKDEDECCQAWEYVTNGVCSSRSNALPVLSSPFSVLSCKLLLLLAMRRKLTLRWKTNN